MTIAITNEPDSRLGAAARHVIELRTGPERPVAATKTYTASLRPSRLAALVGGRARAIPDAMARQLRRIDGRRAAGLGAARGDRPWRELRRPRSRPR